MERFLTVRCCWPYRFPTRKTPTRQTRRPGGSLPSTPNPAAKVVRNAMPALGLAAGCALEVTINAIPIDWRLT